MCTNNGCFLSSGISCNNAGTQLRSSWRQTCTQLYTVRHTHTHTHIHTENYLWLMTNGPSWEANYQKILRLLWNTEAHYRVHNSPPPVHVLSQINPVHAFALSLRNISLSTSHLRLGLQSGFYPSGVPTKTLYEFIFTICATCPANLILLDLITRIFCDEYKSWWPSTCNLLPPPILPPLRIKYLPQHPITQHLRLMTFLSCDVRSSTYIKISKITIFYIFDCIFSTANWKTILEWILSTSYFNMQVILIY